MHKKNNDMKKIKNKDTEFNVVDKITYIHGIA